MSSDPPTYESTPVAHASKKGGPLSGGVGLLLVVGLLGAAGTVFYRNYWNAAADVPVENMQQFKCTGDDNVFMYAMKKGDSVPVTCPACKKTTGYPCEPCFGAKGGGTKDTATFVILNRHLGKEGDTICPDCGRVVVGHNPDARKAVPRGEGPAAAGTTPSSAPTPAGEMPKGDRDR